MICSSGRDGLVRPSEPVYERAIEAFTTLEQRVRAHMVLEDNLLIPLVLAIEHPELVSVRRSRDGMRGAGQEQRWTITGRSGARSMSWSAASRPLATVRSFQPQEQMLVLDDVATLALLLREQIALEDKCLWPRAIELFRALE